MAQTHTWTGAVSTDWNTAANWSAASVPSSTSDVLIGACSVCPALASAVIIQRLRINGGSLTLGNQSFRSTYLNLNNAYLTSNGAIVYIQNIEGMQGSNIYGTITFNLNDGQQTWPGQTGGNNTFHGDTDFVVYTNPASGAWGFRFGTNGTDTFKGNARFRNIGPAWLHVAYSNTAIFEKDLVISNELEYSRSWFAYGGYIICKGNTVLANYSREYLIVKNGSFTGSITIAGKTAPSIGEGGNCSIQGDVILSTAGVVLTNSTLGPNAALKTIPGGVDFTNASSNQTVSVKNTTFQNINQCVDIFFKSSVNSIYRQAQCMIGPGVVFNGKVNMIAHYFELNGAEYKKETVIEKTGANLTTGYGWNGYGQCAGGNIFRSSLNLINSSGTDLKMAVLSPDRYEADIALTYGNTGCPTCTNGTLQLATATANNYFGGNITVNSLSGAKGGIILGGANLPWQLRTGKLLQIGSFPAGSFILQGMQQQSAEDISLALSANASLAIEKNNLFRGRLFTIAPRVTLNGSTFQNEVSITKTGSGTDNSYGGNIFYKKVTVKNSAPAGSTINMATVANDFVQKNQ